MRDACVKLSKGNKISNEIQKIILGQPCQNKLDVVP